MFNITRRFLIPRAPHPTLNFQSSFMMAHKRGFNEGARHFKKNKKQKMAASSSSSISDGSNEDVLLADVKSLLSTLTVSTDTSLPSTLSTSTLNTSPTKPSLPAEQSEIDLNITELSSTGDGLALHQGHVYVVPFSAPGDVVTAKPYKHNPQEGYSLADFVKIVSPSPHRTEVPKCQYFSKCSGCQFQYLPYDYQLQHKRRIVEKAYRNFSKLSAGDVPTVGETIGSPLQYGYRTKLTPHFDGPPGGRRDKRQGKAVHWPEVPPIGFMLKGTRKTMDIEDCPIGTDSVRAGMKRERRRVRDDIDQYQKGATLLLRENTKRTAKDEGSSSAAVEKEAAEEKGDTIIEDHDTHTFIKSCITNQKSISTEYIDGFRLDNPAGAFFQNNNSILPLVTQYLRENILDPSSPSKIKNMIDAYCGSGFFTITLSQTFSQSIGIDISAQSIDFASQNATLNALPESSTNFIAADANHLFAAVDVQKFKPEETVVILDPPRKGCDQGFIKQLLEYAPERICYVSCNVHTQARDVGWLVRGLHPDEKEGRGAGGGGGGGGGGLYEIESVRGFDFFPMTSHVEGVAILRKKKNVVGMEDMSGEGGGREENGMVERKEENGTVDGKEENDTMEGKVDSKLQV